MESVPLARVGFFPLDEQLGLVAGSLSPSIQDHLVHLATWMPFGRAVQMLKRYTGVQVSEATVRRQTYEVGKAALVVQNTQKSQPSEAEAEPTGKLIVSPDGAMVSLLKGVWAEVKTVVVGKVEPAKSGESVHSTKLSYFSRMLEVETFTQQASGELQRRGVDQASEVCAVMDGAEWIDGFLDWQCKDALRILDFAHAAEYVGTIGQLAQAAGTAFPQDWLAKQLHELKHQGPEAVLQEVSRLRDEHPDVEEIRKKGTYLEKRKARMQYPQYQAAGWPIGSGIVESGNKVVMQARLKGAGMHWAPAHVNPLLALRTSACNDRWDETNQQVQEHRACQRLAQRRSRQADRYARLLRQIQIALLLLAPPSKPQPPAPPRTASSPRSGPTRPSASHPWRKPFLAKK
jgi:hypothetical protein